MHACVHQGGSNLITWFLDTGGPFPAGFGVRKTSDYRRMVTEMPFNMPHICVCERGIVRHDMSSNRNSSNRPLLTWC